MRVSNNLVPLLNFSELSNYNVWKLGITQIYLFSHRFEGPGLNLLEKEPKA